MASTAKPVKKTWSGPALPVTEKFDRSTIVHQRSTQVTSLTGRSNVYATSESSLRSMKLPSFNGANIDLNLPKAPPATMAAPQMQAFPRELPQDPTLSRRKQVKAKTGGGVEGDLTVAARPSEFNLAPNVMEGCFVSHFDKVSIYTRIWLPEGKAKGLVLISHNFGEHIGRYTAHVDAFNAAGLLVFGHDHQGHGRSGGKRGDIEDYRAYISDTLQHIDLVTTTYPGLPLFMWGQGMGGCIALTMARKHRELFRGFVLTSPLLLPDPGESAASKILLNNHMNGASPLFTMGTIDAEYLSSDFRIVKAWYEDPLTYQGQTKTRWVQAITQASTDNYRHLAQVASPFIVVQGLHDDMVVPEGAMELHDRASSTDKTIHLYENPMHELYHEPDIGQGIIRSMVEWVVFHLSDDCRSVVHVRYVPAMGEAEDKTQDKANGSTDTSSYPLCTNTDTSVDDVSDKMRKSSLDGGSDKEKDNFNSTRADFVSQADVAHYPEASTAALVDGGSYMEGERPKRAPREIPDVYPEPPLPKGSKPRIVIGTQYVLLTDRKR